MMAGCVWFVMLAFAWYLTFRALGTQRDDLKNKTSYFHIASWCVPLVLTIVCLSVSEVGFFYDIAKMYTILYALSLNLFLRGKHASAFFWWYMYQSVHERTKLFNLTDYPSTIYPAKVWWLLYSSVLSVLWFLFQIDGDSLSGICFVGVFDNGYRGGFVLAPIGLMLVIGLGYLILGTKVIILLLFDKFVSIIYFKSSNF